MPDAEPNTRTIAFPAMVNDRPAMVEATAFNDEIRLSVDSGVRFEVPLALWRQVAPFLTAAAFSLPPDPPAGRKQPE